MYIVVRQCVVLHDLVPCKVRVRACERACVCACVRQCVVLHYLAPCKVCVCVCVVKLVVKLGVRQCVVPHYGSHRVSVAYTNEKH